MLCSNEDIKIYEKIDELIKNGKVLPYEKELIDFLASNTDKNNTNFNSYLEGLSSKYSISKSYLFSRYLMLFLDLNEYSLVKGKLNSFSSPHSQYWIEGTDFVYDVTFTGKWNKEDYYALFNPTISEVINIYDDDEFKLIKENNVSVERNDAISLRYVNWYRYMKNSSVKLFGYNEDISLLEFPESSNLKLIKKICN